jgi:hypothetical protein
MKQKLLITLCFVNSFARIVLQVLFVFILYPFKSDVAIKITIKLVIDHY